MATLPRVDTISRLSLNRGSVSTFMEFCYELIRSFPQWLCHDILSGMQPGTPATMKLAGGAQVPGTVTTVGEVMVNDSFNNTGADITRILPVRRMQAELGSDARWKTDGAAVLLDPHATRWA